MMIHSIPPRLKEVSSNNSEFKIGVLLIKSGKLTAEDARKVVELAGTKSLLFGDAAKELGFVTEQDVQEVLAKQFSYTYVTDDSISPDLVSAFHPKSAEAEFIRGLRTQLVLGWFKDGSNKTLAISSIDPGNGNSRFAANLAVSFSQLGKKTLLIDANLRNPVQGSIFRLGPQVRGLADILIGRAGLDSINNIKAINGLSVLSSGAIPPNPLELVGSQVFNDLLNFLNEVFDIILIDTPAFNVGADAQTIAAAVGGSLLVVRKDVTKAADLSATSKMLTNNGTSVIGTVMTDF